MALTERLRVVRVESEAERAFAIEVMRATYKQEKNWITRDEKLFPDDELGNPAVSWFVVFDEDRPVGTLRVLYDLPLELYQEYGFKTLGGIDIEEFIRRNRIAEIGRFAVLPEYRSRMVVVGTLMRQASLETVERGYTHYVTDIFEGEAHSPYNFHTRVLGFQPVATHDTGELNCPNRRITLILDLAAGYHRLKAQGGWLFRFFTETWPPHVHEKLGARPPGGAPPSESRPILPRVVPAPV
ncbi:MAG: GNAT family N-acetyltransferase [Verrucomicrobiae bacterium]|nr:GNAT family N-acetyltransferase [Verrucomicrobiae bacterium]